MKRYFVDGKFYKCDIDEILEDIKNYDKVKNKQIEYLQNKLNTYDENKLVKELKEEIQDINNRALVVLSDEEIIEADKFKKKHYDCCKSGIEYIISFTGIGTCIKVKCENCNDSLDITDYGNW